MKRVIILLAFPGILAASLFITGCRGDVIRVGSYPDAEGMLMEELITQILMENGFQVVDAGPSDEVR